MAVIHSWDERKRDWDERHKLTLPESITYDPIETAARLMLEHAKKEAAKAGHTIHDDYAADLLVMFGEELQQQVKLAVSALREPLTGDDTYPVHGPEGLSRLITIRGGGA